MSTSFRLYWPLSLAALLLVWLVGPSYAITDPPLQIGVVQRFGSVPGEVMVLAAAPHEHLVLEFAHQVLTTPEVKLQEFSQALAHPTTQEHLVLSTHATYETASQDAVQWRQRGIPVEIAQPGPWQVWAKRDAYNTPLLRRLLLASLPPGQFPESYLDTQVLTTVPAVGWQVGGHFYSDHQLRVRASRGLIRLTRPGHAPRLYPGTLQLQPNAYGTYTLVNQVPLETYLRGVVPRELGPGAPWSAIQAQAVIARTYALGNLDRFAIDHYQLCADTQCQVYEGLTQTYIPADQGIESTRGLVVTAGGQLADTVYSSTTGGVTAAFDDLWDGPNPPYLKSVLDALGPVWDRQRYPLDQEANLQGFLGRTQGFNESGSQFFRWRLSATLPALATQLHKYLQERHSPRQNFTTITGLQVMNRFASGRVQTLRVFTDQGPIDLDKDGMLSALATPYSTLFYLEPLLDHQVLKGYAFIGGGLGHGVGLSQIGSYHLGHLGWSYSRILSFYYPGTQIQPWLGNYPPPKHLDQGPN